MSQSKYSMQEIDRILVDFGNVVLNRQMVTAPDVSQVYEELKPYLRPSEGDGTDAKDLEPFNFEDDYRAD